MQTQLKQMAEGAVQTILRDFSEGATQTVQNQGTSIESQTENGFFSKDSVNQTEIASQSIECQTDNVIQKIDESGKVKTLVDASMQTTAPKLGGALSQKPTLIGFTPPTVPSKSPMMGG